MQLCRHNDNLVIIASTAYDFDFTWKGTSHGLSIKSRKLLALPRVDPRGSITWGSRVRRAACSECHCESGKYVSNLDRSFPLPPHALLVGHDEAIGETPH